MGSRTVDFATLVRNLMPLLGGREKVSEQDHFIEEMGLNSLELLELVARLETELDLEIPQQDLARITTLANLREYLVERGYDVT